tara:strand:- start:371 stop:712 length:342 start_codon:yes stop_codon:yes gene_type:complete
MTNSEERYARFILNGVSGVYERAESMLGTHFGLTLSLGDKVFLRRRSRRLAEREAESQQHISLLNESVMQFLNLRYGIPPDYPIAMRVVYGVEKPDAALISWLQKEQARMTSP